jgi:hypothetical protein
VVSPIPKAPYLPFLISSFLLFLSLLLLLLSLYLMLQQNSVKDFFSKAYKRGFKTNGDIINKEEVKRELQPKTKVN